MDKKSGKRPLRRHSFILSLWAEAGPFPHSPPIWRISLEDSLTTERRGFKDLTELAQFLEKWTAVPPSKETPIDE